MIKEIKEEALKKRVPIIKDEGLAFLLETIETNDYKEILELGTAVAYSAINMANLNPQIHVDTIEKNEDMYKQAQINIKAENKENQITSYFMPIEEFETEKKYDLIFVDAAKAQYEKYMEKFIKNLKDDGLMVFDNMIFHDMVYHIDEIKNRNTRSLVKKIVAFKDKVSNDPRFDIIKYDHIGDGIMVLSKKGK